MININFWIPFVNVLGIKTSHASTVLDYITHHFERTTMRFLVSSLLAAALSLSFFSFSAIAASDMDAWKSEVTKSVAKNQRYPRAALAREVEGKAKVRLTVAADGTISNHEIIEPTGESSLDNEIPRLVKRLSPLPSLPEGRSELSFVLPLDWSLTR